MTRLLDPRGSEALDHLRYLSLILRPPRETLPDQHVQQCTTAMIRLLDPRGSEALKHLLTEHNNTRIHHLVEQN